MKAIFVLIALILAWPLGLFRLTNNFIMFVSHSGIDGMRLFYDSTTPDEERKAIYDKIKRRQRITFFITAFIAFPLEYYWLSYMYSKLPF